MRSAKNCVDGWVFQLYRPRIQWIKESILTRVYGEQFRLYLEHPDTKELIIYDERNRPVRVIVVNNQ